MTEELLRLSQESREGIEGAGFDAYYFGEPNKTQEVLAGLNGSVDTWRIVEDCLAGDWTFFEEYDREVQDGE